MLASPLETSHRLLDKNVRIFPPIHSLHRSDKLCDNQTYNIRLHANRGQDQVVDLINMKRKFDNFKSSVQFYSL